MSRIPILAASLFAAATLGQAPGPLTPEIHPSLISYKCSSASGCKPLNTSIVLDSNYRWLHNSDGYDNCVTTGFDPKFCPDVETCAKTCTLEGVDYASYGIHTAGDSVTLNIFKTDPTTNITSMSSPRIYLMADENTYDQFKLLNQEFSFDVDVSKVPCGINGALYFSEMNETGDRNKLNTAGAKYGTGYCDAQCPTQNFIKGVANLNQTYGACCNEMDIWEANNAATAMTPHPCRANQVTQCSGKDCGNGDDKYNGICDKDGCGNNPYKYGAHAYYGGGSNYSVDTMQPFSVVTQFYTDNNFANGTLTEIRRLYVQNGRVIKNAAITVPGLEGAGDITDKFCAQSHEVMGGKDAFSALGGLKQMGEAIGRGMVLALSIWDDAGSYMNWLDQDPNGPCLASSGHPDDLIKQYPDSKVVFSNIRSGDIGSTFKNGTAMAGMRSIRR